MDVEVGQLWRSQTDSSLLVEITKVTEEGSDGTLFATVKIRESHRPKFIDQMSMLSVTGLFTFFQPENTDPLWEV